MITLDELKRYRSVRDNVSRIEMQIERLRSEVRNTECEMKGVDEESENYLKSIEFTEKLNDLIQRRRNAYIYAVDMIDRIDNEIMSLKNEFANVLRIRYIDGKRFIGWKAAAKKMNYSESHVFTLHREALEKLGIWR